MAVRLMKVGNSFNVPQKTYIANDSTERDNINALFGDLCLVIEDGITYILNSEGEWYPYTIGGGGGNANTDIIAPTYDPTLAYSQYQLIVYDGELYRATEAIAQPAGDFDETKWEKVDIASAKADLIDGKVPASQLPSYVDDVLEFDNRAAFPQIGERGVIYVAIDTGYTYRWAGNEYVAIGTLNTEVHIGAAEPTGEEVIWIKPEGQNQSTTTLDSKEVGDYIYLEETINGVTTSVPYRIMEKDDNSGKAILFRSYANTLGYELENINYENFYNNLSTYQTNVMNIFNENVQDNAVYAADCVREPGMFSKYFVNSERKQSFYAAIQNTEDTKDIIIYDINYDENGQVYGTEAKYGICEVIRGNEQSLIVTGYSLSNTSFDDIQIRHSEYNHYFGIALEMDLDAPLVGIDASIDTYANYTLKFKKDGLWNDLNDLRIATRAELLTVEGNLRQSIETVADQLPFELIFTFDENYDGPELEEGQIPAKANYTFAEIHEALESGKEVHSYMLLPSSGLYPIFSTEVKSHSIYFQGSMVASENFDRLMVFNLKFKDNEIAIITMADKELPEGLPQVTSADNGKFAKVVNGEWSVGEGGGGGGIFFVENAYDDYVSLNYTALTTQARVLDDYTHSPIQKIAQLMMSGRLWLSDDKINYIQATDGNIESEMKAGKKLYIKTSRTYFTDDNNNPFIPVGTKAGTSQATYRYSEFNDKQQINTGEETVEINRIRANDISENEKFILQTIYAGGEAQEVNMDIDRVEQGSLIIYMLMQEMMFGIYISQEASEDQSLPTYGLPVGLYLISPSALDVDDMIVFIGEEDKEYTIPTNKLEISEPFTITLSGDSNGGYYTTTDWYDITDKIYDNQPIQLIFERYNHVSYLEVLNNYKLYEDYIIFSKSNNSININANDGCIKYTEVTEDLTNYDFTNNNKYYVMLPSSTSDYKRAKLATSYDSSATYYTASVNFISGQEDIAVILFRAYDDNGQYTSKLVPIVSEKKTFPSLNLHFDSNFNVLENRIEATDYIISYGYQGKVEETYTELQTARNKKLPVHFIWNTWVMNSVNPTSSSAVFEARVDEGLRRINLTQQEFNENKILYWYIENYGTIHHCNSYESFDSNKIYYIKPNEYTEVTIDESSFIKGLHYVYTGTDASGKNYIIIDAYSDYIKLDYYAIFDSSQAYYTYENNQYVLAEVTASNYDSLKSNLYIPAKYYIYNPSCGSDIESCITVKVYDIRDSLKNKDGGVIFNTNDEQLYACMTKSIYAKDGSKII